MAFNIAFFLLSSICFGLFAWSVIGVFNKAATMDVVKYRILQIFSISFWIYSLFKILSVQGVNFLGFLSIILCILSLSLFLFAKQSIKNHKFHIIYSQVDSSFLIETGIYNYTRHPFYISYILCYFSVSLYTKDIFCFILLAVLYFLYYNAAKKEELDFLNGAHKDQYLKYKKRTFSIF